MTTITKLTWTPDNDTPWADVYALACRDGATAEAELREREATAKLTGPIDQVALGYIFIIRLTLGDKRSPSPQLTSLTVAVPEPEPDWLADGFCVDKDGDLWLSSAHDSAWSAAHYQWPNLPEQYGPYARHPAVIAAERRGAGRVAAAVREARAGHPACDRHGDADPVTCGWKRAVQSIDAALDALEAGDE